MCAAAEAALKETLNQEQMYTSAFSPNQLVTLIDSSLALTFQVDLSLAFSLVIHLAENAFEPFPAALRSLVLNFRSRRSLSVCERKHACVRSIASSDWSFRVIDIRALYLASSATVCLELLCRERARCQQLQLV